MSYLTSKLKGKKLDWAVAKALGYTISSDGINDLVRIDNKLLAIGPSSNETRRFSPSTIWAQGGPIKSLNLIATHPKWQNAGAKSDTGYWYWMAYELGPDNIDDNYEQSGKTELIASMRCVVAMKLGDKVEIPSLT